MNTTVLAYISSPSQGVWHLGFVPLRAYALCIIAGIIAALVIGDRRWVARGGQPGVIYDVALWAVPFGLVGGRLYHVMTDWPTYFGDDGAGFFAALRIWDGGLGIWGAVALGGVGAWIACRRREIPLPAFGDAVAPGIVLAQAIGRLGNYFNQELYGRATTLPWGLKIFERRDANGALDTLNGVSTGQQIAVVHPTFLYELLWNLLVFAILIWVDRRFKLGHGRLFALYVAAYCVGRFWIELMRSDHATDFAGIRVNSFTSTFVFIGAVIYIMVAPKGREDPASLAGNDADSEAGESALDEMAKDLAAVAATSGVVAAAVVADEVDERESKADAEAISDSDSPEAESKVAAEPVEASADDADGLGSVEGDEVAAAAEDGPEVHDALVEGTAEAEELAADVAEPEAEADSEPDPDETVEAEADGLGSVEGDEVVAAAEVGPEVHGALVEGTAEAEELAADVAEPEAEPEAEADSEPDPDETVEAEADGLGSVEGDEVAAAAEVGPEVHEALVEGTAEAEELATDIAEPEAEPDPEETAEAEADGLGSVEGDEVAAAAEVGPQVHGALVEGTAEAEELAADVAEPDSEPDPKGTAEAEAEGGLGSVETPDVAAAILAAPKIRKAAVKAVEDVEDTEAETEVETAPQEERRTPRWRRWRA